MGAEVYEQLSFDFDNVDQTQTEVTDTALNSIFSPLDENPTVEELLT